MTSVDTIFITESKHIYFQLGKKKGSFVPKTVPWCHVTSHHVTSCPLCPKLYHDVMLHHDTSHHVTSCHVIVYFQLAMLSALLDLLLLRIYHYFSNFIIFYINLYNNVHTHWWIQGALPLPPSGDQILLLLHTYFPECHCIRPWILDLPLILNVSYFVIVWVFSISTVFRK